MLKDPINVTCVLEKEDVDLIEKIAEDTGANKSVLIRMWITERLNVYKMSTTGYKAVDLNKFRTGGE